MYCVSSDILIFINFTKIFEKENVKNKTIKPETHHINCSHELYCLSSFKHTCIYILPGKGLKYPNKTVTSRRICFSLTWRSSFYQR